MEEGSQQGVAFENTREVMYKFLDEKLKIERPREKIELQRIHRLGRPNSLKPRPIISRFLRYSDRELVMDSARKHLKAHQDFHVFKDIPKDLYDLRKLQMKQFKEARERGHKAYFSKANQDKLSQYLGLELYILLRTIEFLYIILLFLKLLTPLIRS